MSTPHQHQHGVTIGGKRYTVDANGKFVKVEDEPQEDDE